MEGDRLNEVSALSRPISVGERSHSPKIQQPDYMTKIEPFHKSEPDF